jgi:hypothetical protein
MSTTKRLAEDMTAGMLGMYAAPTEAVRDHIRRTADAIAPAIASYVDARLAERPRPSEPEPAKAAPGAPLPADSKFYGEVEAGQAVTRAGEDGAYLWVADLSPVQLGVTRATDIKYVRAAVAALLAKAHADGAAGEREECAKEAEHDYTSSGQRIAAAIRARGEAHP